MGVLSASRVATGCCADERWDARELRELWAELVVKTIAGLVPPGDMIPADELA